MESLGLNIYSKLKKPPMGVKGIYDIRKTNEQFIQECKQLHGELYDYKLVDYKSNKTKVKIICKSHGCFEKTPKCHIQLKQGCPKCSRESRKIIRYPFEEFIKIAKEKYKNFYEYEEFEYYSKSKLIKVICPNHGEYKIAYNNHLKYKCKRCYYENIGSNLKKTKEQFIKESIEIHGNMYDYSLVDYKNSRGKVKIICKICNNEFFQTASNHLSGSGCNFCVKSKGEKLIEKYLLDNNIKYQTQFMFSDCRNVNPLKFDFYLEDLKLCIEFDGVQHYDETSIYWSEDVKRNDIIKNDYCKINSINLLRIPYYRIKNIDSFLNKVLSVYNVVSFKEKEEFFITKSKQIWGDKYDYSLVEYIDDNTPVIILYKGLKYRQKPKDNLWGNKCENSNNKRMSTENFILKSKELWGDRFDYNECEYLGTNCKIKLFDKYNKKWIYQIPKSHLKGRLVNKNTEEDLFERISYVHEFKYNYRVDYKNLYSKLEYECPLHGITNTKCYSHLYGGSCVKCDEYRFNSKLSKFLNKLELNFSKQYHFEDCRERFALPFDFYIRYCNILIEYDGLHKFEPNLFGINDFELSKIKQRDRIKNDYCEEKYINLIRIRYDEISTLDKILYPYLKNFTNKKFR